MQVIKTKLKNGLTLLTIPMPNLESATITIWVGVGSRYENPKQAGIAHFFEHIVFKGSQKRPSAKAISEAIDNFGGEVNAFTGKELTGFYIKAPIARLEDAIDILSDMVINPIIPKEEVEREKGVIHAEMDMVEDTPMQNIVNIFHSIVFQGNPLERTVIGSKKTVSGITREDFIKYQKSFYSPSNIVVTIAGGVDIKNSQKLVKKYFGNIKNSHVSKSFGKKVKLSQNPKIKVVYKKTDQSHLMIGYLGDKLNHNNHYAEQVLRAILSGGMSSRMFLEIRERQGLCYAIRSSIHPYLDTGAFLTYVGTEPAKVDKAVSAILTLYKNMTSDKLSAISKQELLKAKEYLKGHLALSLESTNEVNDFFGAEQLLLGQYRTIEEVFQKIDAVTANDVIKVAKKFFRPERLNLAIIGPHKSSDKFKKLLN